MILKAELRCVFVAAYFVKTGYCSVHQNALRFGERKSRMARRKQQESEEVKKTPVRIKQKKVKISQTYMYRVALSIENKGNGLLTSLDRYKRTTN